MSTPLLPSLDGTVIIVTGASSGIGAAGARELASRGATVAVVGRNEARTREVAQSCGPSARAFLADFTSLADVARLGHELRAAYPRIDVLVNNAGFIAGGFERTADGIESTFAVNHVATFLLTELLGERLRANRGARVITTSSVAHASARRFDPDTVSSEDGYSAWQAYCRSKLANVLFTRELARRWDEVSVNCFHPGVVRSGFGSTNPFLKPFMPLVRLALISSEQGADTMVHLASSPDVAGVTGAYWVRRKVSRTSGPGDDAVLAGRLWDRTSELVAPFVD